MIPIFRRLLPCVAGTIERRVLVNFKVDPSYAARRLPPPFRPQLVRGQSLAGICLIRLEQLRPAWCPKWCGVSSENAAHRIAVEWSAGGCLHQGVFVARRHTNSTLTHWAGGRVFPGVHQKARFRFDDLDNGIRISLGSGRDAGPEEVGISAHFTNEMPSTSVFAHLEEASEFFRRGCEGWSLGSDGLTLEGTRLEILDWKLQPLRVLHAHSSLLQEWFGSGAAGLEFDSAFLMQNVVHRWIPLGRWPGDVSSVSLIRRAPRSHRHAALFELP